MTPSPAAIHREARRRANELRDQAFDDALRWLAARLRDALPPRRASQPREASPCRS